MQLSKLKRKKLQDRKQRVKEKLFKKRKALTEQKQSDRIIKRYSRDLEKLQNPTVRLKRRF